jgi:outer membrane beta-barrel protein
MNGSGGISRHVRFWGVRLLLAAAVAALAVPGAAAQAAPDSAGGDLPVPPVASASDSATVAPPVETAGPSPSSATAASDPNPRPAIGSRKVRLIGEGRNVVRSGPGDQFALAGAYDRGTIFTVHAKTGDWYGVRISDYETAWIHSSLCEELEDMGDLEFRPNPKLYARTGSYVLSGYAGGYAFDRKSNSLVLGARLGYYVFDRLQAEAGLAWTHINRPAEIVETLFGLTLEAETFHMLFYSLNLTYEVLPGRQMVPFVTLGAGTAIMKGETEPAFNFGAGTMLFLSKRVAMRWEVRDYRLSTGNGTSRVSNDNIEFTLGTNYLF